MNTTTFNQSHPMTEQQLIEKAVAYLKSEYGEITSMR